MSQEQLDASQLDRRRELAMDWLVEQIAELLAVDPETVPDDSAFTDLGLSSVMAVELSDDLQGWTGLTLPPTLAYDYPTIESLAGYIAEESIREGSQLSASHRGDT
jgi:acyl carrier protein